MVLSWLVAGGARAQPTVTWEDVRVVELPGRGGLPVTNAMAAWSGGELLVLWQPYGSFVVVAGRTDGLGGFREAPSVLPLGLTPVGVAPFRDAWAVVGADGTHALIAVPIDRTLALGEPIPLGVFAHSMTRRAIGGLGGSLLVATEGAGCVEVTELRADGRIVRYAPDSECDVGTFRFLEDGARRFVAVGRVLFEMSSSLLVRREAAMGEVFAVRGGRAISARPASASSSATIQLMGLGPEPVDTIVSTSWPSVLTLVPTATGWVLGYSTSERANFARLAADGTVIDTGSLGTASRFVPGDAAVYGLDDAAQLLVIPATGGTLRRDLPASAARTGRWITSVATPAGAWLLVLGEVGDQRPVLVDEALRITIGEAMALPVFGYYPGEIRAIPAGDGLALARTESGGMAFGTAASPIAVPTFGPPFSADRRLADLELWGGTPTALAYVVAPLSSHELVGFEGIWAVSARPVALPYGLGHVQLRDCGEARVIVGATTDGIVAFEPSAAGVTEIWRRGGFNASFTLSSAPEPPSMVWTGGGELRLSPLDAHCRPTDTQSLGPYAGLEQLSLATAGDITAVAWTEPSPGRFLASFASPSGVTEPYVVSERTMASASVVRLPDGSFLFHWSSMEAEDSGVRPRLRRAYVTEGALDAGAFVDAPIDPDAGTIEIPDGGAIEPPSAGCGCRAQRGGASPLPLLLLLLLVRRR